MNKDALLATLIGFGIGLTITSALLFGPGLVKSLPTISFPQITFSLPSISGGSTPLPQTTPSVKSAESGLVVESPSQAYIATSADLLVSGTTTPQAIIVVQTELDDVTSSAKDDGIFSAQVKLSEGRNDVVITSFSLGKLESKTVTVYFTTESL